MEPSFSFSMSSLYLPLILLAFCLLMVAFLSSSEAAIISVNRLRIRHLVEKGSKKARKVQNVLAKHDRFFATILATENLFIILATSVGTALALSFLSGEEGILAATIFMTVVIVIFGEITPKTIAAQKAEQYSLFVAGLVELLIWILTPLMSILTFIPNILLKYLDRKPAHRPFPTIEELKMMISLSTKQGILLDEEESLLNNIFEFAEARAGDAMVPRTRMASVEVTASLRECVEKFVQTGYSRFPVHEGNLDTILGFVDVRRILAALSTGEAQFGEGHTVREFLTPAVFIPESKKIGHLLRQMQEEHFQLAIILDEYGGTAGLISLTDIIEEIVGKFETTLKGESPVQPLDEKNLIVPASARLEEIEEFLGIKLNHQEYQTVGGLVFGLMGRVPEVGEQIRFQSLKFTVTEKDGYKISRVMVTRP